MSFLGKFGLILGLFRFWGFILGLFGSHFGVIIGVVLVHSGTFWKNVVLFCTFLFFLIEGRYFWLSKFRGGGQNFGRGQNLK